MTAHPSHITEAVASIVNPVDGPSRHLVDAVHFHHLVPPVQQMLSTRTMPDSVSICEIIELAGLIAAWDLSNCTIQ